MSENWSDTWIFPSFWVQIPIPMLIWEEERKEGEREGGREEKIREKERNREKRKMFRVKSVAIVNVWRLFLNVDAYWYTHQYAPLLGYCSLTGDTLVSSRTYNILSQILRILCRLLLCANHWLLSVWCETNEKRHIAFLPLWGLPWLLRW